MENEVFVKNDDLYGKEIKNAPRAEKNIGIDTEDSLIWDIASATSSQVDMQEIEKFTRITNDRNTLYSLIDQMAADSRMSTALEYYAEDSTEKNDQGKIVWAEANDSEILKYINFLLNSLNIDKNVYKWVYSLCKYGDVYIRLYRESEIKDELFDDINEKQPLNESKKMDEDVKVKAYSKNDNYVHYVEMVSNPAEMFELVKFGKSQGYIEAPSNLASNYAYTGEEAWLTNQNNAYVYKFKREDVILYPASKFVHAALEDDTERFPETVDIFRTDDDYNTNSNGLQYTVRRGTSMLANMFKTWRELMLLENSVLLNRVTKSSIVRLIQVQIGDMPKEMVPAHLRGVKSLIEQKAAIKTSDRLNEYTNPGPIENNVYVPIRGEQGTISTSQIGGDVDVKSLADLEYFKDKLFGQLGIPKQYMGDTDDAAGFNGGTALSLTSSKYAKRVKKIQNAITQMITDIINLMLIDKKQTSYINKFSIHMLEPMTEEQKNRQENISSEIQVVNDVMNLLGDLEDQSIKLKALKAMLSNVVTNSEVIDLIQEQIDQLELQNQPAKTADGGGDTSGDINFNFNDTGSQDFGNDFENDLGNLDFGNEAQGENNVEMSNETQSTGGETQELPNMNEIGLNFADSEQF